MHIYLPVAGISTNPLVVLIIGLISGIVGNLFGIGGGFIGIILITKFGIPPTIAIPSYTHQMITMSFFGIAKDSMKRLIDFKMALNSFAGGLLGSIAGAFIFNILVKYSKIEIFTVVVYLCVLLFIGAFILIESFNSLVKKKVPLQSTLFKDVEKTSSLPKKRFLDLDKLPYKVKFDHDREISLIAVLFFGFIAGFLLSSTGVATGFILVPTMFYIYKMSIDRAFASSNVNGGLLILLSSAFQILGSKKTDIVLSILLTIGGVVGSKMIGSMSKRLSVEVIRALLGFMIFLAVINMIINVTTTPTHLFEIAFVS